MQLSASLSHRRFGVRIPRVFRAALVAIAATVLVGPVAGAQTLGGLPVHMSATTRISAAVRAILTLTHVEIASVQDLPSESRVSSRVAVSANVPYRVAVRAAAVLSEQAGTVVVRDYTGAWVPLSNDRPVVVGQSDAGVNTHDVECRVLADPTGAAASPTQTVDVDAQSCSLAYELAPRNDAAVLAAVAVLPVGSSAVGVGSRH